MKEIHSGLIDWRGVCPDNQEAIGRPGTPVSGSAGRCSAGRLRVLIFGGPVALSFAAALLLSHALPRATGPWTAALWVGIVAIASLLTLVVFGRAARRLLPLAALLNVSLRQPLGRRSLGVLAILR